MQPMVTLQRMKRLSHQDQLAARQAADTGEDSSGHSTTKSTAMVGGNSATDTVPDDGPSDSGAVVEYAAGGSVDVIEKLFFEFVTIDDADESCSQRSDDESGSGLSDVAESDGAGSAHSLHVPGENGRAFSVSSTSSGGYTTSSCAGSSAEAVADSRSPDYHFQEKYSALHKWRLMAQHVADMPVIGRGKHRGLVTGSMIVDRLLDFVQQHKRPNSRPTTRKSASVLADKLMAQHVFLYAGKCRRSSAALSVAHQNPATDDGSCSSSTTSSPATSSATTPSSTPELKRNSRGKFKDTDRRLYRILPFCVDDLSIASLVR